MLTEELKDDASSLKDDASSLKDGASSLEDGAPPADDAADDAADRGSEFFRGSFEDGGFPGAPAKAPSEELDFAPAWVRDSLVDALPVQYGQAPPAAAAAPPPPPPRDAAGNKVRGLPFSRFSSAGLQLGRRDHFTTPAFGGGCDLLATAMTPPSARVRARSPESSGSCTQLSELNRCFFFAENRIFCGKLFKIQKPLSDE